MRRAENLGIFPSKEDNSLANKSLYVGNLSRTTTESEIRTLFEPFGPIAEVRLIGANGFGFVDLPAENMQAAIDATNGKELSGATLTVNEARPKTDRSSGGRGGGYGGGGRSGGYGGGGRSGGSGGGGRSGGSGGGGRSGGSGGGRSGGRGRR